ncbi:hypothetical protein QBC44DRAFT_388454, partial [Cladorrhinum sp. PSN332]
VYSLPAIKSLIQSSSFILFSLSQSAHPTTITAFSPTSTAHRMNPRNFKRPRTSDFEFEDGEVVDNDGHLRHRHTGNLQVDDDTSREEQAMAEMPQDENDTELASLARRNFRRELAALNHAHESHIVNQRLLGNRRAEDHEWQLTTKNNEHELEMTKKRHLQDGEIMSKEHQHHQQTMNMSHRHYSDYTAASRQHEQEMTDRRHRHQLELIDKHCEVRAKDEEFYSKRSNQDWDMRVKSIEREYDIRVKTNERKYEIRLKAKEREHEIRAKAKKQDHELKMQRLEAEGERAARQRSQLGRVLFMVVCTAVCTSLIYLFGSSMINWLFGH